MAPPFKDLMRSPRDGLPVVRGVWGQGDDLGMLNFIDNDSVRLAVHEI